MNIIISVGTSLLEKNADMKRHMDILRVKKIFEDNMADKDVLRNLKFEEFPEWFSDTEVGNNLEVFSAQFVNYYDEKAILKNMANRKSINKKDRIPEEIASLCVFFDENDIDENRNLHIITTDSAESIFCAMLVRTLIEKTGMFRCRVYGVTIISDLDPYHPKKWTSGIRNLQDFINGIENPVIIRTGGFSEFTAELKLIAETKKLQSYFLFPKSLKF